uniref:Uncharacterized protein n=1 Tax=Heterorhabditis bacteriophora TaxID=37862 RepID=A0A1I7WA76_HETBA
MRSPRNRRKENMKLIFLGNNFRRSWFPIQLNKRRRLQKRNKSIKILSLFSQK